MRLIKVTGGLGNQMFIYAFYLRMRKRFTDVRIDLSDMMHYKVHYGYEMHKVFNLPYTEFCINQRVKKVLEFLFFKTILERKQHGSMKPYTRKYRWPFIYFKGFYQNERYFEDIKDEVRNAFTFDLDKVNEKPGRFWETLVPMVFLFQFISVAVITCYRNTGRLSDVFVSCLIIKMLCRLWKNG